VSSRKVLRIIHLPSFWQFREFQAAAKQPSGKLWHKCFVNTDSKP